MRIIKMDDGIEFVEKLFEKTIKDQSTGILVLIRDKGLTLIPLKETKFNAGIMRFWIKISRICSMAISLDQWKQSTSDIHKLPLKKKTKSYKNSYRIEKSWWLKVELTSPRCVQAIVSFQSSVCNAVKYRISSQCLQ